MSTPGAYTRDGVRTSIIRDPDGQPLAFDTLNGPRYYPYLDAQGSVQALITTGAEIVGTYTYTPYGTTTPDGQAADDNPLRWLGQLQDPHGRHHLGYRYYHPLYGRFTQPDPSGQELNPYAYAAGDPINNSDPSGLVAPVVVLYFALAGAASVIGYEIERHLSRGSSALCRDITAATTGAGAADAVIGIGAAFARNLISSREAALLRNVGYVGIALFLTGTAGRVAACF